MITILIRTAGQGAVIKQAMKESRNDIANSIDRNFTKGWIGNYEKQSGSVANKMKQFVGISPAVRGNSISISHSLGMAFYFAIIAIPSYFLL